jgi:signal transduction histidine kinase
MENAFRHTPPGGKIFVEADLQDREVQVAVQDTGEGIPSADLPHVFDRFFRGERSRSRGGYAEGGAGLGLAIAKGLVEAHGGRIWVESSLEAGTVMAFSLPRVRPAETLA